MAKTLITSTPLTMIYNSISKTLRIPFDASLKPSQDSFSINAKLKPNASIIDSIIKLSSKQLSSTFEQWTLIKIVGPLSDKIEGLLLDKGETYYFVLYYPYHKLIDCKVCSPKSDNENIRTSCTEAGVPYK